MKTSFKYFALLFVNVMLCVSQGWGAEGDTHDFAQSVSQLLNNSASISSIEIENPGYPVKQVIVTLSHNKNITNAVTIAVSVGEADFGSTSVTNGSSQTASFQTTPQSSAQGKIAVTFTNNVGSGTGKGTFSVSNVRLVEGSSAPVQKYDVTYHAPIAEGVTVPEAVNVSSVASLPNPGNPTGCDQTYAFVGWITSSTYAGSPTIYKAGESFVPTDNTDLYAVYGYGATPSATDYEPISSISELNAGEKVILWCKDKVLNTSVEATNASSPANPWQNPAAGNLWTLEESSTSEKWCFTNGTSYLSAAGTSSGSILGTGKTYKDWTIEEYPSHDGYFRISIASSVWLEYYSGFKLYGTGGAWDAYAFKIYAPVRVYTNFTTTPSCSVARYRNYLTSCEAAATLVTFNSNGGLFDGDEATCRKTYSAGETDDACGIPVRAGHTFEGFTLTQDGTDYLFDSEGHMVNRSGYITSSQWDCSEPTLQLYAKWTIHQHTLTWDFDGGVTTSEESAYTHGLIDFNTPIVAPANPTKDGFRFTGWSTTPASTMPDADVTYTAQWTRVYYDHFFVNGTEVDAYMTEHVDGKVAFPAAKPTSCDETNYPFFVGWAASDFEVAATAPALIEDGADREPGSYYAVFAAGTPGSAIFTETFAEANGTGGNDNKWTGSIAAADFTSDNIGWTVTTAKSGSGCAKFGTGSAGGSGQTPAITMTSGVLTFRAASWGTDGTVLSISLTSGTLKDAEGNVVSSVNLKNSEWSTYTLYISGVTTSTQITFSNSSSNKRFFLDDVVVRGGNVYTEWITRCCVEPGTALSISGGATVAYDTDLALTANGGNDGTVVWSVTPDATATISDAGVFHATKKGTYTVTASQDRNGSACATEAQKTVTVTAPLTSIVVTGQTTTCYISQSFVFDGTCTATYADGSEEVVDPTEMSVDVAQPFAEEGVAVATITYTEDGVTKSTTIDLTITTAPIWTITLNACGGTLAGGAPATFDVLQSDPSAILPSCDPTCEDGHDWEFAGWSTALVPTTVSTTPATMVPSDYTATGDVTLYAVYSYVGVGGSGGSTTDKTSFNTGGAMWSGLSNYSNLYNRTVSYTVPEGTSRITKIVVTPNNGWGSSHQQKLVIKKNDDLLVEMEGNAYTTDKIYSTAFDVVPGDVIKFQGVARASSTIGVKSFAITRSVAGTTNYYNSIPCGATTNLTLDKNNGLADVECVATYGSSTTECGNTTREGYTLDGYTITLDGDDYVFNNEGTMQANTAVTDVNGRWASVAEEMTLYAHWTPINYTLTYENAVNGVDDVTNSNLATYTIETETFSLTDPTRTGYAFAGWYEDEGLTTPATTTIELGSVGNKTFYAKWDLAVTNITITSTPVEGVSEIPVDATLQLAVTFSPAGATAGNAIASWTVDNSTYLDVSESGLVTGKVASNGHYVTATTTNGVQNTYYINVVDAACENMWQVHMWNTESSTNTRVCLSQVGETNEWRSEQVTLPSWGDAEKLKVLYNGMPRTHSAEWKTRWLPMIGKQANNDVQQIYPGQDAVGYFRIYTNSSDANYYLAFQPTYVLTYGVDGQGGWQQVEFEEPASGHEFQTAVVKAPTDYFSTANFNCYVGTKRANGTSTFVAGHDSREGRSETFLLKNMTGLKTSDMGGHYGYYKIFDDSADKNWYVSFVSGYAYELRNEDESLIYAGTSKTADATTIYNGEGSATLPTKTGYTLIGWNRAKNQTTTTLTLGADYTFWSSLDVFYPVWRANEYTFTLDKNTGDADGSVTISYDATAATSITHATKTGYTLQGYNSTAGTDGKGGGTKVLNVDGTIANNLSKWVADGKWIQTNDEAVLYAAWTVNKHNLTWVTDGDALTGTYTKGTVAYDTDITAPNTPTKTGYTFAGWSPALPAKMPDADVVLTATWTINQFNVTYHHAGENHVELVNYNANPAGFTPDACSADGRVFVGWSESEITTAVQTAPATVDPTTATITAAKDFYAVYASRNGLGEMKFQEYFTSTNRTITDEANYSRLYTPERPNDWDVVANDGERGLWPILVSQGVLVPNSYNYFRFSAGGQTLQTTKKIKGLLSFDVVCRKKDSSTDLGYFVIQYSENGIDWFDISRMLVSSLTTTDEAYHVELSQPKDVYIKCQFTDCPQSPTGNLYVSAFTNIMTHPHPWYYTDYSTTCDMAASATMTFAGGATNAAHAASSVGEDYVLPTGTADGKQFRHWVASYLNTGNCESHGHAAYDEIYKAGEHYVLSHDVTMTAVWDPTLTWYNEQAGTNHAVTYATNDQVVLPTEPDPVPCNSILEFVGWGDQIATTKTVEPTFVSAGAPATVDKTYYAIFKHKTKDIWVTKCPDWYTITYHANGGTGEDIVIDSDTRGLTTQAADVFTNTGHQIVAWSTVADLSGDDGSATLYKPATEVTIAETPKDAHLYAVWMGDLQISSAAPISLTSYKGVEVFTTTNPANQITVSSTDMGIAKKLRFRYLNDETLVSGTDRVFRVCNTGYSQIEQNIDLTTGAFEQLFNLKYIPNAFDQKDTYTIRVEATNGNGQYVYASADLVVNGRSLPEKFVIAMKKDSRWYALRNDLQTSESTPYDAVPIMVDNASTPTIAIAPENTWYKADSRNNTYSHVGGVRFRSVANAGHLQASKSNSSTGLWLPTSTCSTGMQEWYLMPTDYSRFGFTRYTVGVDPTIVDGSSNPLTRKLSFYDTKIGWYTTSNNEVYFLPIADQFGDMMDIVDWSTNSVVLNMNGYADEVQNDGNPMHFDDRACITMSGLSLNPDEYLQIHLNGSEDDLGETNRYYRIPHVLEGTQTISSSTGYNKYSILYVRNGKTTIATNLNVSDVIVCPGAELVIASGSTLTTDRLLLRGKIWSDEQPIFTNNGTLSAAKSYYARIVSDNSTYYQFGLPYSSTIANVEVSTGEDVSFGPVGKYWNLRSYNTINRAAYGTIGSTGKGNWEDVTTGSITATQGYEMASGSDKYREYYFPITIPATGNGETSIAISHPSGSGAIIDQGWNYFVSPSTSVLRVGEVGDPSELPKLTELLGDNRTYSQHVMTELKPFFPVYYQAPANINALNFSFASAPQQAPALLMAVQPQVQTQWVQLMIEDEADASDETNLYYHPTKFTPMYDMGYDVGKLKSTSTIPQIYTSMAGYDLAFCAVPDSVAAERIPVQIYTGQTGAPLVVRAAENNYMHRLANLYFYDDVMQMSTDLLTEDYVIYDFAPANTTLTNRFYLQAVFAEQEEDNGPTTDLNGNAGVEWSIAWMSEDQISLSGLPHGADVYLYDPAGKLINQATIGAQLPQFTLMTTGVYMLRVQVGDWMEVRKFVKK